MIATRVQAEPFDVADEEEELTGAGAAGAVVAFTGIVRGEPGAHLTLEHYPGMTEAVIAAIAAEAERRWRLTGGVVIHRYGRLAPGDPIVLVAVAARHRKAAFEAAAFMVDRMKTEAPFWKKETDADGNERWVEARTDDEEAAALWKRA